MTSKLHLIGRGLVLASMLLLGACAVTGPYSGGVSASKEDEKIVAAGGYSEAAVAQVAIVCNPMIKNGCPLKAEAVTIIQKLSMSCQQQLDPQLAGQGQGALGGAVIHGAAGLGVGVAADAAFVQGRGPSLFSTYSKYGVIASLAPGALNGLATSSYSLANAKGSCTVQFWRDVVATRPEFRGTHVIVATSGKRWGDSMPPELKKEDKAAMQKAATPSPPVKK